MGSGASKSTSNRAVPPLPSPSISPQTRQVDNQRRTRFATSPIVHSASGSSRLQFQDNQFGQGDPNEVLGDASPDLTLTPNGLGRPHSSRDDVSGGETASSLQSSLDQDGQDRLNEQQIRKVRMCLDCLESYLDVTFNLERILEQAQVINFNPHEQVLTCGEAAPGIYVVDSGAIEVYSEEGQIVSHLLAGDFCGELATLFEVNCSAHLQTECITSLLLLPRDIVADAMLGQLDYNKLMSWCAMNSYIDLCDLFDNGMLAQQVALLALKNCALSEISNSTVMSKLAQKAALVLYSPGDVVCEIGEVDAPVYIIVRGSFEVSKTDGFVGHKKVKRSSDCYPVNIQEFLENKGCEQCVKAIGPCVVMVMGRMLLHDVIM